MKKTKIVQEFLKSFNYDKFSAIKALQEYTILENIAVSKEHSKAPVIISLDSVSKIYKLGERKIRVLENISLDIYEGEFIAIIGSSGSGKSTLLQLIGGLDRPTTGTITINNKNIEKLNDRELSHFRNSIIGFVFQFFYLQPFLKLSKNIEVTSMFAGTGLQNRDKRTKELLISVGLDNLEDNYPRQMSGGQIQRAAIARALFNKPKIILADEPTGNLDSKNTEAVMEVFENLRKQYNVTLVIVTHDTNVAKRADRVLTMMDGNLL